MGRGLQRLCRNRSSDSAALASLLIGGANLLRDTTAVGELEVLRSGPGPDLLTFLEGRVGHDAIARLVRSSPTDLDVRLEHAFEVLLLVIREVYLVPSVCQAEHDRPRTRLPTDV